jgi:cellulose synthase/poly-beta-1,6-N-acetylglucosamine synthase-like glycosyltransferase
MVDSMIDFPKVSVVIPCRNEARFIGSCLDGVQDLYYPRDLMEVEIVDGMSTDGTRDILERCQSSRQLKVLDNSRRTAAAAMNIGIAASSGAIIVRLDAHARYPAGYVRSCVSALAETQADIVGGVVRTLPGEASAMALAIAVALSSRFGVGGTAFRVGWVDQPTDVDIVPFGCFKRSLVDTFGWYDETMLRDEDADLCFRVKARGGRVLLCPGIHSEYAARRTLPQLWVQYFLYGFYKPAIARKVGRIMTIRQLVPPVFVVSLLVLGMMSFWSRPTRFLLTAEVALYATAVIVATLIEVLERRNWRLILLGLVYPVMHVAYGVGYTVGAVRAFRGARQ